MDGRVSPLGGAPSALRLWHIWGVDHVRDPGPNEGPGSVSGADEEGLFRAVLAHSAVPTALVAPDGGFLVVNAALCAMLGRTEAEVTASTWQEFTHEDDLAADIALLSEVLAGQRDAYRLSKRYVRPDGEVVFGDLSVACIRGPDGKVTVLIKQVVDVTGETIARDRYRLLAENATDMVFMGDNAGVLRWASPSVREILGWAPDEIEGGPFLQLVHEEDWPAIRAVQAGLLEGQWGSVEARLRRADGGYSWVDIRIKPVLDAAGGITGRIASLRLAVAKVERERFRAALDAELDAHVFLEAERGDDGVIKDLVYVEANAAATDYVKLSRDELIGSRLLERFPGQGPSGLFARYVDTIETGHPLIIDDVEIVSEISGSPRHLAFRGVKVGDGLSLTWRDVTATVTAAQSLAESEARYQLLAENASDVVFEGDRHAVVQWVSPSVRDFLGLDPDDVIGRPAWSLVHPDDVPRFSAASDQANSGDRTSYRARYRRADGTLRWAEVTARPIQGPDGEIVARVGSLRDVNEQVLAELALAAAEERYRLIAENASDLVCLFSPEGVVKWAFGGAEPILGQSAESLIGTDGRGLWFAEDRGTAERYREALLRGETVSGLVRVHRVDGDGHWVHHRTHGVWSASGEWLGFVSSWRDAQAEVEYRERLAESERQALDLAERFEAARDAAVEANMAKTSFLSRMSHELRTPLNAVLGFAQLLAMDPLTPDQRDAVQHIRTGGKHLLDLITEILDISRIEAGRLSLSMESVFVADAVAEALDLVRPVAEEAGIVLAARDDASCSLSVWADRQRVIQILLNLLTNAVKYNRPGGTYSVQCAEVDGGMVAIRVSDTGIGISEAHIERLFSPFDRLGAEATAVEGTGIGLTLSEALARVMSGRLDVSSTPGEGSVFSLVLPSSVPGVPDAMPVPLLPVPGAGRQVRVLYVEDNPANQHLMTRIAALREGVTLMLASDGRSGLQMALDDPPDLILLDLHLPDLSGDDVLLRLRADDRTAEVPVLVVTADASVEVRHRLELLGSDGFLTKPVEVSEVLSWFDSPHRQGH